MEANECLYCFLDPGQRTHRIVHRIHNNFLIIFWIWSSHKQQNDQFIDINFSGSNSISKSQPLKIPPASILVCTQLFYYYDLSSLLFLHFRRSFISCDFSFHMTIIVFWKKRVYYISAPEKCQKVVCLNKRYRQATNRMASEIMHKDIDCVNFAFVQAAHVSSEMLWNTREQVSIWQCRYNEYNARGL